MPILRYPGAKWSMAKALINYFPEHKGYLEPFFGSGAILFNKAPVSIETVNDLDGELINFFRQLKSKRFKKMLNILMHIPYARDIYYKWHKVPRSKFQRALRLFIISWMSHGGYQPHLTGWSNSKNPNGPNKARVYFNTIAELETYHNRLKNVTIENTDGIKLIEEHDFKGTFIYIDPPYVLETRKSALYKKEMDDKMHQELLKTIVNLKNAKVLISGYECDMYNEALNDWNKAYIKVIDGKGNKKTEVIWYNYDIQQRLF